MDLIELLISHKNVLADALSRFIEKDNPNWDGRTHQHYLFLWQDFLAHFLKN